LHSICQNLWPMGLSAPRSLSCCAIVVYLWVLQRRQRRCCHGRQGGTPGDVGGWRLMLRLVAGDQLLARTRRLAAALIERVCLL
jgi:hypothetical protein